MTKDEIRNTVERLLGALAPEVDFKQLKPERSLREQIDLDSMDYLNFVIALSKEFDAEVTEADYAKLATLNDCVEYLSAVGRSQRQL